MNACDFCAKDKFVTLSMPTRKVSFLKHDSLTAGTWTEKFLTWGGGRDGKEKKEEEYVEEKTKIRKTESIFEVENRK